MPSKFKSASMSDLLVWRAIQVRRVAKAQAHLAKIDRRIAFLRDRDGDPKGQDREAGLGAEHDSPAIAQC